MINLSSNKGSSETVNRGIIFFTIFFIAMYMFVTYGGAGRFISAEEVVPPPEPNQPSETFWGGLVDGITYTFSNMGYFFNLMTHSASFGVFTGIIMVVWVMLIIMFILHLARGN